MPLKPEPRSPIRLLAPNVINKIAAGEVVDRPASVVKELIENALDAGAGTVRVHLDAGGRKRICVSDDGCGMDHDDALLAVERHATSKIRDVDDIEQIATLGFRGEALAATAAVSRFVLRTATGADDRPGTEIALAGGVLRDVRDIGFPRGTTIEVRDLFFNVPARRKFLRSAPTELAHARQVFIVHALAHPDVGFSWQADQQPPVSLSGGEDLETRLGGLFGGDLQHRLRPIDYSASRIRIHGFAGIPPDGRRDRDQQIYFINGRPAGAPLIGYAVREGYQNLMPRDRHPTVILFIETDPGDIDVNVHPQKREVRFREPAMVRDAIQQALATALRTVSPGAHAVPTPGAAGAWRPVRPPPTAPTDIPLHFDYPAAPSLPPPAPAGQSPTAAPAGAVADPANPASVPAGAADDGLPPPAAPWTRARVVGQVGGLFVLLETDEGLVIMDPHAAHERVLFDRYLRTIQHGRRPAAQELLVPATVKLPPLDAAAILPHLDRLQALGFGIHEFGVDGLMIDAVPAGFEAMSPDDWVTELVADFKREGGGRRLPRGPREDQVARAACRAAVKAHQQLSPAEIERLVSDLAATEMPYTCPHGRPILIHMSFAELRQRFGR